MGAARGRPSSGRIAVAGGILLTALAGLFLLLSLRRGPGRLFGTPSAVPAAGPSVSPAVPTRPAAPAPLEEAPEEPSTATPAPASPETLVAVPEPEAVPRPGLGTPTDAAPPVVAPAEPGSSSAAAEAAAVPADPYRRIELALSRLRKDAAELAEPPADGKKNGEGHD
jgi:hypothetical protein